MNHNHPLLSAWRKQSWPIRKYLLSGDEIPPDKQVTFTSYGDFINNDEYPGKSRSDFHLGLIPVPFHGDLKTATIFICLINPGLNVLDYYAEDKPKYRRLLLDNLKQDLGSTAFPFFPLDPNWRWTSSGKWWSDLFENIVKKLIEKKRVKTYAEALEFVSKRIASLELIPYHSFNSGHVAKLTSSLRSSILIKDFVQTVLLPRAKKDQVLIVLASGANKWNVPKRHRNVIYQPKKHRRARLSMKPSGSGSKILKWLLK